jgi:bacterioferritin-associated ferredoxin
MYVCVCRAVSDKQIKAAIDSGADTVAAVTAACCAGDDCGACHGVIEEMIDERREATGVTRLPVVRERAA